MKKYKILALISEATRAVLFSIGFLKLTYGFSDTYLGLILGITGIMIYFALGEITQICKDIIVQQRYLK